MSPRTKPPTSSLSVSSQIYNEVIRDLLNPASGFLDLREDARGTIQIAGITEVSTSNAQEVRSRGPRTHWPLLHGSHILRAHKALAFKFGGRAQRTAPELPLSQGAGNLVRRDPALLARAQGRHHQWTTHSSPAGRCRRGAFLRAVPGSHRQSELALGLKSFAILI